VVTAAHQKVPVNPSLTLRSLSQREFFGEVFITYSIKKANSGLQNASFIFAFFSIIGEENLYIVLALKVPKITMDNCGADLEEIAESTDNLIIIGRAPLGVIVVRPPLLA
jgi:hypothetical protein